MKWLIRLIRNLFTKYYTLEELESRYGSEDVSGIIPDYLTDSTEWVVTDKLVGRDEPPDYDYGGNCWKDER